jgi:8-oxo-dGTP pyrophosphatase MutT (NUDIX family)
MISTLEILGTVNNLGTGFLPVDENDWWFAIGNKKYWKIDSNSELMISFTSIGGHVERNESILDGTHREIKEETGINARIISAEKTLFIEAEIIENEIFNFNILSQKFVQVNDKIKPRIIYRSQNKDKTLGVAVFHGEFLKIPFPHAEVPALICLPPKLLNKCPVSLQSLLASGTKLKEQENIPRVAKIYPFGSASIIFDLIRKNDLNWYQNLGTR